MDQKNLHLTIKQSFQNDITLMTVIALYFFICLLKLGKSENKNAQDLDTFKIKAEPN